MVYGLPNWADTPTDPHSAFTHLKNYPIAGGLVDGPVYTNIYKGLIGITLANPDEYAEFQSNLAVYHDDYGDYITNEPTMDYCDWTKRDSLLVTKEEFDEDPNLNYQTMSAFGITKSAGTYFLPPYEWYNESISYWRKLKI